MKVHKFNNKQSADEAMAYLNQIHGLPVEGGISKFDETSYRYSPEGFYYIPFSAEWTSELGETVEIELPTQKSIE